MALQDFLHRCSAISSWVCARHCSTHRLLLAADSLAVGSWNQPGTAQAIGTPFLPVLCWEMPQRISPTLQVVQNVLSRAWSHLLLQPSWQWGTRGAQLCRDCHVWGIAGKSAFLELLFAALLPYDKARNWLKPLYSSWGWITLLLSRSDMNATKEVHQALLVQLHIQKKCVQGPMQETPFLHKYTLSERPCFSINTSMFCLSAQWLQGDYTAYL